MTGIRPRPVMDVRRRAEDGAATVMLPMLVWLAALVALFAIDLGAYLVAASRAQALADAAVLAAVGADVRTSGGSAPASAARVVAAGGGRLERCDCRDGGARALVEVSVAVPGLIVPSLGAARVTARAEARLVP